MSLSADEDLLNGGEDFDYESYDLGYEEEEALLEDNGSGDEEEFKSKQIDSQKKEASSETEEPEDVLNLGIEGEEDFQDVDEKTFEEETPHEKKESKFIAERPASSNAAPPKVLITKKPLTTFKNTTETEKTREVQTRQLDNRRRRGVGRSNFQQRTTYVRNNVVKDRRVGRRNGTVFINPKYEGVVQINENNARLAWDNPTYSQNNGPMIQPWASGNNELNPQDPNASLLLNNLVGIAATFAQSPNLLQVAPPQTQVLNFEPPANVYQNVPSLQPPFNNSGQVVPSQQTPFPSYQSSGPQQYSGQPLTTSYNYYNNSNPGQNFNMEPRKNFNQSNYENRNDYYNRVPNTQPKSSFQNNYLKQEYQSGNFGYNNQNKNSFYGHSSKTNQNTNHNFASYENRSNINKPDSGYNRNFAGNYNRNYNSDGHLNFNNNRNVHNRPLRQIVTRNEPNKQQNFNNPQSDGKNQQNNPQSNNKNFNNSQLNKNFTGQNNRQHTEVKSELPEKRVKIEERSTKVENQEKTESKEQQKQTSTSNPKLENEEEEDEEMRLYRLKIEEQKREREKVLKMKEERRRMMLLQKENEKTDNTPTEKKPEPPVAPVVQKFNRQQFGAADKIQQSFANPVQKAQFGAADKNQQNFANPLQKQNYQQRIGNPIPVVNSQTKFRANVNARSSEGDFSNLTFKISNTLLPKTVQSSEKAVQQQKKEQPSTTSSFMSQRVVVVKNKSDVQKGDVVSNSTTPLDSDKSESDDVGQGLSSFFNNRKVLKKDNSLINTRLVVVNNLSASTTQNKLVAMTRGIGDIQKLRMDNQERQATILFKSVASAHAFFKKYQRHMLDLSMIEVKLEPMI